MQAGVPHGRVDERLGEYLYLTGSFFMLEVYDRVIPSRSVPTLLALAVLALTLYAFQGVLEAVRARIPDPHRHRH